VGSPPFHGRTPQALLAAQLTELPPPLSARRYDVPVALADLIMKCLEKDPADRPRAAQEILSVLDNADALAGPVAAPPRVRHAKLMNRGRAVLSIALPSALILTLVTWAFWPERSAGTQARTAQPVVHVATADTIGSGAGSLAAGISAALQTALIQGGVRVANGAASVGDSASYLVQTTVQRAGDRARANIRLFLAGRDSSLWADQVDYRVDDSFAAQDSLAARLVRAVRAATSR